MITEYPITPIPKPRMTQSDRWRKRPAVLRYFAFADQVRAAGVKIAESGTSIIFYLPMPKSWSKKKRDNMRGQAHQQKPDLDNLLKALSDAVYADDSVIWNYHSISKRWSDTGSILVSVAD